MTNWVVIGLCFSRTRTLIKIIFIIIHLSRFAFFLPSVTLKNKLKSMPKNPLLELEKHAESTHDLSYRQIGFCARWCLDNYCETILTINIQVSLLRSLYK